MTWRLPGVDIAGLIKSSDVFGQSLRSADDSILRLQYDAGTQGGGMRMPFATDVASLPIPVIRAGDTVAVEAPEAFATAYLVCGLARAKQHQQATIPTNGKIDDIMTYMETMYTSMDDALVEIAYFDGADRRRHAVRIVGALMPFGAPPIQSKDDPTRYEMAEGIAAAIERVLIIPDERERRG